MKRPIIETLLIEANECAEMIRQVFEVFAEKIPEQKWIIDPIVHWVRAQGGGRAIASEKRCEELKAQNEELRKQLAAWMATKDDGL
jgi:hypothetical protein